MRLIVHAVVVVCARSGGSSASASVSPDGAHASQRRKPSGWPIRTLQVVRVFAAVEPVGFPPGAVSWIGNGRFGTDTKRQTFGV